jgi:hypothetical protein
MWPILMAGILGFFLYEAIKTSESVARLFGKIGKHIHEIAITPRRTLARIESIEQILDRTTDTLECATSYLVIDADYHHHADVILAERGVTMLLPKRIPYSDFRQRWSDGWRP